MKKQFVYNTFLNIGLILMIISGMAAYNSKHYWILVASIIIAVLLIYIKYQLLKQVKEMTKNK